MIYGKFKLPDKQNLFLGPLSLTNGSLEEQLTGLGEN